MSEWKETVESCGEIAATRFFEKRPDATHEEREHNMALAVWVLMVALRRRGAREDEIDGAVPLMFQAYRKAWSDAWWASEQAELLASLEAET